MLKRVIARSVLGGLTNRFYSRGPIPLLTGNVKGLERSPTLEINEISNKLKKEGKTVYKFGLGQSPFPVPELMQKELVVNAFQKDYLPVNGLPDLRDAVAAYQRRFYKIPDRTGDDILIGPGTKQLIFQLLLCYAGQLILPRASWVSYAPQAVIVSRDYRWLDTTFENGWKVTATQLRAVCEENPDLPRVLLLNYPSNPHGQSYSNEECMAIAEVAREFRLLVLSDEIYHKLYHKVNRPHHSVATYYPEGTVILDGISKWAGAGGWRCGAFSFPPSMRWLLEAMSMVASETHTSVSAPIQHAAVSAYERVEEPEMEKYLRNSCRILDLISSEVYTQFSTIPGCRVHKPEGGFYIMPDFSGCTRAEDFETSKELAESIMLNSCVAALHGGHFGRRPSELMMRFAFVDFDGANALEAIETLPSDATAEDGREFVKECAPRVVDGMSNLREFFEGKKKMSFKSI